MSLTFSSMKICTAPKVTVTGNRSASKLLNSPFADFEEEHSYVTRNMTSELGARPAVCSRCLKPKSNLFFVPRQHAETRIGRGTSFH